MSHTVLSPCSDFVISYSAKDDKGHELYLALLSDWDLDAAFFGSSEPCLKLKVDLKPFEDGLDDWDLVGASEDDKTLPKYYSTASASIQTALDSVTSQFNKTMSSMGKYIGVAREQHTHSSACNMHCTCTCI